MNKDLQIAKKTVQTEIQALKKLSLSFNNSSQFSKAVNLISKTKIVESTSFSLVPLFGIFFSLLSNISNTLWYLSPSINSRISFFL